MAVAAAIVIVMVMTAVMIVMMTAIVVVVMMVAAGMGVKIQLPCQKGRNSLIGIAADTAVNGDIRLFQSDSRTAADAAADQSIDT